MTSPEPRGAVTVTLSGEHGCSFVCEAGDTLLGAALRAGVGIPYECSVGSCGSCKCQILDGSVKDLCADAPGLNAGDRRRGRRLACQITPLSDCTVTIRVDATCAAPIRPSFRRVELKSVTPITPDISAFLFQANSPAAFLPGQYARLQLCGVDLPRPYSMSNIANDAGEWEFMIRRVPNGKATGLLFDTLRPGDQITLDGPYSTAYLRLQSPRPLVCIAGGSGLAPILSVLRGAAASAELAGRPIDFFYGARGPQDMINPELLAGLGANVRFHPIISMPELDTEGLWAGRTGMVHDLVERTLGERAPECEFYLAGPPPMVEATRRLLLLNRQVPAEQLHYDRFF
jgi:toluene monooxygenase electron transfer component